MLSVPLPAGELEPLLGDGSISPASTPPSSASPPARRRRSTRWRSGSPARGVEGQRIAIDIAAHSRMLEPILERFGDYLRGIRLSAPKIPFVSNRTGVFITDAQATDPDYWVGHLRDTVRFADGITTLASKPERVYLEVGPGKALSSLTQAHGGVPAQQVMSSLRHPEEKIPDDAYFLGIVGRLWATGVAVDWEPVWGGARRARVPLPTYPFQRAPYFIAPGKAAAPAPARPVRSDDIAAWGWRPAWRPRLADGEADVAAALAASGRETWLVFVDDAGVGARMVARLRAAGQHVVEVHPGDAFARTGEDAYLLPPERGRDRLRRAGPRPGGARRRAGPGGAPLAGDRARELPPRLELLPPQPGARLLEPAVPGAGAGRREPADALAAHRGHLRRRPGQGRAAALPGESDGARPGQGDPARAAGGHRLEPRSRAAAGGGAALRRPAPRRPRRPLRRAPRHGGRARRARRAGARGAAGAAEHRGGGAARREALRARLRADAAAAGRDAGLAPARRGLDHRRLRRRRADASPSTWCAPAARGWC